jgi:hypothetical protein
MKDLNGNLHERTETLFVCDEYKVFFLTGQANGTGRRAYIAAKAFHTLDDEQQAAMRGKAVVWVDARDHVQIAANQGMLAFRDILTGTTSNMPWGELDADVQQRLRGGNNDPFLKYAGTPTKTVQPIAISKPLVLKRNP